LQPAPEGQLAEVFVERQEHSTFRPGQGEHRLVIGTRGRFAHPDHVEARPTSGPDSLGGHILIG
jgi:hypothetical protein